MVDRRSRPRGAGPARVRPSVLVDEASGEQVELRRSPRRRRTVSAYREDGRVVLLLPDDLPEAAERRWAEQMVGRVLERERRRRPGDEELARRAAELSRRYLAGRAVPSSVTWSTAQQRRWGSCTPMDGTIRLSARAQGLPPWVLDYILLHELAHLIEPSHSSRFWELLGAYRLTERARGWLEGYEAATARPAGDAAPGSP